LTVATITASTNTALLNALKSASNGDVINLTGGTYSLVAKNIDKSVTITTSAGAVFNHLEVIKSSGLTFDGVDFNGPNGVDKPFIIRTSDDITIRNGEMEGVASGFGTGRGVWVGGGSTDFTLANMDMHGFATGIFLANVDGVRIRNNTLSNISNDGLIAGDITDAVFSGNVIDLNTPLGKRHTDGMQFWNNPPNAPSSNITIEDNVIRTHNIQSHGIYMANAVANGGGGSNSFYKNVTIEGNVVVAGDGFGISWGQTNNLEITENIVIKDPALIPSKGTPSIRVAWQSTDVEVTQNVVQKVTVAADSNWQTVTKNGANGEISDKVITLGTTLAGAKDALAVLLGNGSSGDGPYQGTAGADTFRFDAKGATDFVKGVNFAGGDKLVLHDYETGTFLGGAAVGASSNGTTVTIDSYADLRALDKASPDVRVHEGVDDTIAIVLKQDSGDHWVRLVGNAHDYF
jgi:hypothetical protein